MAVPLVGFPVWLLVGLPASLPAAVPDVDGLSAGLLVVVPDADGLPAGLPVDPEADPVWVNVLAQHADVAAECLAAWACVHAAVEACWAALVGVWALSCVVLCLCFASPAPVYLIHYQDHQHQCESLQKAS